MKIRNAHKFNNFVVRLFSICVFNICLRPACCNLISLFTQVYLMPGSFVFRVLHFIIIAEDGWIMMMRMGGYAFWGLLIVRSLAFLMDAVHWH